MRFLTGYHAIEEYLLSLESRGGLQADRAPSLLYARTNGRIERIRRIAERLGLSTSRVDTDELDSRVGRERHRGVVLEVPRLAGSVERLDDFLAEETPPSSAVLALDGVTDPHNLGAVLRSAEWFGVDLVVLPNRRSAGLTDTVLRTSAGAASRVPTVTVPNLVRALGDLKDAGFWVYGAEPAGEEMCSAGLTGRVALVLGSEGAGLSRLTSERCDVLVRIPSIGTVESLNVSVAAGILLYEMRRQQKFFG